MAHYTRDRGFNRARRMGRDQEEGLEELHEMLDDPNVTAGELLAALIEHAPPDKEEDLHNALREMGEDRRGYRSWAKDRLERRALDRGMRRHRPPAGRDFGPENLTQSGSSRPVEEFFATSSHGSGSSNDWRPRSAADMAYDRALRSPRVLDRVLAGMRRIERF
jgi:hypothetical protein